MKDALSSLESAYGVEMFMKKHQSLFESSDQNKMSLLVQILLSRKINAIYTSLFRQQVSNKDRDLYLESPRAQLSTLQKQIVSRVLKGKTLLSANECLDFFEVTQSSLVLDSLKVEASELKQLEQHVATNIGEFIEKDLGYALAFFYKQNYEPQLIIDEVVS